MANSSFGPGLSLGKAVFQATAHGISGEFMSLIQGGKFGSGFVSGAISSGMASGSEALHLGPVMMIAVGGVSGGVSSAVAGGSFWDGARQGLISSGLNHALHMADDGGGGGGEDPISKKLRADLKKSLDNLNEISENLSKASLTLATLETGGELSSGTFSNSRKLIGFTKLAGNLGSLTDGASILFSTYRYYKDPLYTGFDASVDIGGNLLSMGTGAYVGSRFGGGWGAAAGLSVDLLLTTPTLYRFSKAEVNRFSINFNHFNANFTSYIK